MRIAGEERWIASEDAGLYRDALGAVPPGGLPAVFLEDVKDPLPRLARRYARTHGPFTTREMSDATGSTSGRAARAGARRRPGPGELRPGGSEREWCDPDVLRRLRRASLATLRKEVEPAEQRALARFLPEWQGVDTAPPGGAGVDRLREMLVPLQGLALAPEVWERDVLPRRVGAYSPAWMDQLCAQRRAGVGGRRRARPATPAGWRCTSARTRAGSGRRPSRASAPTPAPRAIRERLARGAAFWTDLLADLAGRRAGGAPGGALGPRLGRRGHQRRVRAAARAAAVAARRATATRAGASPAAAARARRRSRAAGRSPSRCSPARPLTARACARSRSSCSSATAS